MCNIQIDATLDIKFSSHKKSNSFIFSGNFVLSVLNLTQKCLSGLLAEMGRYEHLMNMLIITSIDHCSSLIITVRITYAFELKIESFALGRIW